VLPDYIDPQHLPVHIAVIMDGNGRWAKKKRLPRIEGHRAAGKSVRTIVEASAAIGIKHLTLYAFSTENWKRPEDEVGALMDLFDLYLNREKKTILDNNVRFKVVGRRDKLKPEIIAKMESLEATSIDNTGITLNLALNYGGRVDLVDCVKKIIKKGIAPDAVDEQTISDNLYTSGQPDPDLLIRTSGEMRISNFMLWQIAYTEIWVTDVLWPDFSEKDLFEAIHSFQERDRRYGGIKMNE
jgi:undecaprenyl diphosphate synthase